MYGLDASEFKEALRLVRNTVEEIEFDGIFEVDSNSTGGIGPFKDFPKLKKISTTDFGSLFPWPGHRLKNSSLLELLPPNLESLHFTDESRFMYQFLDPELMSTFYKCLEDVALAKERSPLKKLANISMKIPWQSQKRPFSEEDIKGVATICKSSGIEWKHEVRSAFYGVEKWYDDGEA
jgi:hypothetical protein